jgi:hypothetical protein
VKKKNICNFKRSKDHLEWFEETYMIFLLSHDNNIIKKRQSKNIRFENISLYFKSLRCCEYWKVYEQNVR